MERTFVEDSDSRPRCTSAASTEFIDTRQRLRSFNPCGSCCGGDLRTSCWYIVSFFAIESLIHLLNKVLIQFLDDGDGSRILCVSVDGINLDFCESPEDKARKICGHFNDCRANIRIVVVLSAITFSLMIGAAVALAVVVYTRKLRKLIFASLTLIVCGVITGLTLSYFCTRAMRARLEMQGKNTNIFALYFAAVIVGGFTKVKIHCGFCMVTLYFRMQAGFADIVAGNVRQVGLEPSEPKDSFQLMYSNVQNLIL